MSRKVDAQIMQRIVELRERYSLTNEVIAIRLGISARTVRVYLRAHRTGTVPYQPHRRQPFTIQPSSAAV